MNEASVRRIAALSISVVLGCGRSSQPPPPAATRDDVKLAAATGVEMKAGSSEVGREVQLPPGCRPVALASNAAELAVVCVAITSPTGAAVHVGRVTPADVVWTSSIPLSAEEPGRSDFFELAFADDLIAVGRRGDEGSMPIEGLRRSGIAWSSVRSIPVPDNEPHFDFGAPVELAGDVLVAGYQPGAPDDSELRLYRLSDASWVVHQSLTPPVGSFWFWEVATSPDRRRIAAVAMVDHTSDTRVEVFAQAAGKFAPEASLSLTGRPHASALDDVRLAVQTIVGEEPAQVHIATRTGQAWTIERTISSPLPPRPITEVGNTFGLTLALHGRYLAIGERGRHRVWIAVLDREVPPCELVIGTDGTRINELSLAWVGDALFVRAADRVARFEVADCFR
jgi:hypothetical protein